MAIKHLILRALPPQIKYLFTRGLDIGEEAPVIPSIRASRRYRIDMTPNSRNIEVPHLDRTITVPPKTRGTDV